MRSKSENVTPLKRNECPPKKGTISKNNFILQPLITKGTCDVLVFRGVTAGSPTKTSPQCVSKQTNHLNHPTLTSKLFFWYSSPWTSKPRPYKTLWFWGFRCFFQKNGLLIENFLSYLIPGYTSRIPHHPPPTVSTPSGQVERCHKFLPPRKLHGLNLRSRWIWLLVVVVGEGVCLGVCLAFHKKKKREKTWLLPFLKLTASLHLKMDGWNTDSFPFRMAYFKVRTVSLRECTRWDQNTRYKWGEKIERTPISL